MFGFGKNKKEPDKVLSSIDRINLKSIDELIKDSSDFYLWDIDGTKAVLSKCSTLENFVDIHSNAFCSSQHPEFNNGRAVSGEILNIIFLEVCKSFNLFIKIEPLDRYEHLGKIIDIYASLGAPWRDRDNSSGRELLRVRLAIKWRKLAAELFVAIKEMPMPHDAQRYVELFHLCPKDDPIIFEIAEEINKLS